MIAGSRLLVSVLDNVHYMYDALRPHLPPIAQFCGHEATSFYSRTAFSPDGRRFVAGAKDKQAYIWEVPAPTSPYLFSIINLSPRSQP